MSVIYKPEALTDTKFLMQGLHGISNQCHCFQRYSSVLSEYSFPKSYNEGGPDTDMSSCLNMVSFSVPMTRYFMEL